MSVSDLDLVSVEIKQQIRFLESNIQYCVRYTVFNQFIALHMYNYAELLLCLCKDLNTIACDELDQLNQLMQIDPVESNVRKIITQSNLQLIVSVSKAYANSNPILNNYYYLNKFKNILTNTNKYLTKYLVGNIKTVY